MRPVSQHSLIPYKLYYLICASFLFISIIDLPDLYLTVLRYIIILGAISVMVRAYCLKSNKFWLFIFGAVAVLYNPFFPFQQNLPADWAAFHIITAMLFIARVVAMCSIQAAKG